MSYPNYDAPEPQPTESVDFETAAEMGLPNAVVTRSLDEGSQVFTYRAALGFEIRAMMTADTAQDLDKGQLAELLRQALITQVCNYLNENAGG